LAPSSPVGCDSVESSSPPLRQNFEPVVVEDVTDEDSDDELDDVIAPSITHDDDDDSVDDLLADDDILQKLVDEMGLDPSIVHPTPASRLSAVQISEIAQACVKTLEEHGRITLALLSFLSSTYDSTSKTPTSSSSNAIYTHRD
jgi:hypothetical protein